MPPIKPRHVPPEARMPTRSTAQQRESRRSTSTFPERRGARGHTDQLQDGSFRRSGSLPPPGEGGAGEVSPNTVHQRREDFAEYALMTVNTRIVAIKMAISRFESLCKNVESEESRIPTEYEKLRKEIISIGTHAMNQGIVDVCADSIDFLGLELETICNRIDSHLIELHGVSTFSDRIPIPRIQSTSQHGEQLEPPTTPIQRSITPPNTIPLNLELQEAAQTQQTSNPPTPAPQL